MTVVACQVCGCDFTTRRLDYADWICPECADTTTNPGTEPRTLTEGAA